MIKEDRLNRVLAGLSHTGYTTEIEKCEARLFIEELFKENNKYKEVIDKAIELIDYYGITPEENDNITLRYILKNFKDILKEVE